MAKISRGRGPTTGPIQQPIVRRANALGAPSVNVTDDEEEDSPLAGNNSETSSESDTKKDGSENRSPRKAAPTTDSHSSRAKQTPTSDTARSTGGSGRETRKRQSGNDLDFD